VGFVFCITKKKKKREEGGGGNLYGNREQKPHVFPNVSDTRFRNVKEKPIAELETAETEPRITLSRNAQ